MKKQTKALLSAMIAAGMAFSAMGTSVSAAWVKKDSDYYYQNSDGTYKTGWIKTSDGDYYYCLKDGKMARNCTIKINGESYKFGKDGKAVNKPSEVKTSDKKEQSAKADSDKKKPEKNQNTFPSLVTYGVYCGMSSSDFKALKNFENFVWDRDNECYVIDQSIMVYLEDGRVSLIQRGRYVSYGYTDRRTRTYISIDSAEKEIKSWRKTQLKMHKGQKVLRDTTTDSLYSDGMVTYITDDEDVVYFMTDARLDSGDDCVYAFDGYMYVGD